MDRFTITPDYTHPMKKETNKMSPRLIKDNRASFPSLPFTLEDTARVIDRQSRPHQPGQADNLLNMWAMEGMGRTDDQYLQEFTQLTGKNLGIMHRLRYLHRQENNFGGLDQLQNITLAAESVDHDTRIFLNSTDNHHKDLLLNQYLLGLCALAAVCESTLACQKDPAGLKTSRSQAVALYTQEYLKQLPLADKVYMRSRLQEVLNPDKFNFEKDQENPIFHTGGKVYLMDLYQLIVSTASGLGKDRSQVWSDAITQHWMNRGLLDTLRSH